MQAVVLSWFGLWTAENFALGLLSTVAEIGFIGWEQKRFNWFAIEFKESAKSSCSRKLFHSLGDSDGKVPPLLSLNLIFSLV